MEHDIDLKAQARIAYRKLKEDQKHSDKAFKIFLKSFKIYCNLINRLYDVKNTDVIKGGK